MGGTRAAGGPTGKGENPADRQQGRATMEMPGCKQCNTDSHQKRHPRTGQGTAGRRRQKGRKQHVAHRQNTNSARGMMAREGTAGCSRGCTGRRTFKGVAVPDASRSHDSGDSERERVKAKVMQQVKLDAEQAASRQAKYRAGQRTKRACREEGTPPKAVLAHPREGAQRKAHRYQKKQPAYPSRAAGASNEPHHSQGGPRLPPLPQHGGHRGHAELATWQPGYGRACALWGAN